MPRSVPVLGSANGEIAGGEERNARYDFKALRSLLCFRLSMFDARSLRLCRRVLALANRLVGRRKIMGAYRDSPEVPSSLFLPESIISASSFERNALRDVNL